MQSSSAMGTAKYTKLRANRAIVESVRAVIEKSCKNKYKTNDNNKRVPTLKKKQTDN